MRAGSKAARRLTILFLSMVLALACLPAAGQAQAAGDRAKNVIVLIADGCGVEHYTLARWYKGSPLALDQILTGAIKTHSADSVITDSAAAATAFATGRRTSHSLISSGPQRATMPGLDPLGPGLPYRPLATVLEGARLLGKATGIVVTSRISHATPGAYVAHVPLRYQEAAISEQAVYQGLDLALGGGMDYLLPRSEGGRRKDGRNLLQALQERGYQVVRDRAQLQGLKAGKVFGLFAKGPLPAEVDRPQVAPDLPTLAQMTAKALELLSQDPDGFFLIVESSQVDWAGHANDPAYLLGELMMYDQVVGLVLDFARRDGQTLVLAVSDHSTGGLTIGSRATELNYQVTQTEQLLAPLRRMTRSARHLWKQAGNPVTSQGLMKSIEKYWGIRISQDEARQMLAFAKYARQYPDELKPFYAIGQVVSAHHTLLGWTTHGHVGGDVPLYAMGPGRPSGVLECPQLAQVTARALGLDLARLNQRLVVEASQAFGPEAVRMDLSQPGRAMLQVSYQGRQARLPANQNLLLMDGRQIKLEGLVFYLPETNKAYLPLQAVKAIKGLEARLPSVAR